MFKRYKHDSSAFRRYSEYIMQCVVNEGPRDFLFYFESIPVSFTNKHDAIKNICFLIILC